MILVKLFYLAPGSISDLQINQINLTSVNMTWSAPFPFPGPTAYEVIAVPLGIVVNPVGVFNKIF